MDVSEKQICVDKILALKKQKTYKTQLIKLTHKFFIFIEMETLLEIIVFYSSPIISNACFISVIISL